MSFEEINILELLPQREPFIAVGRLLHFDMETTITLTKITAESLFVSNGELSSSGVIENIAQTCATRIGYINKYILKKGIQIGFIGAIRKLEIYRLPKVGETIKTTINVVEEVFGMTLVSATVFVGEELIADTEMKIAVKEQES